MRLVYRSAGLPSLCRIPLPAQSAMMYCGVTEECDGARIGLSPVNVGRMLMRGSLAAFKPCPALACIEMLQRSQLPIRNKKVGYPASSPHCLVIQRNLVSCSSQMAFDNCSSDPSVAVEHICMPIQT